MNIEKLVIEELTHCLHEWGLQGSHKEHVKFRQKVMQAALGNLKLKDNEINFEDLKKNTLPSTLLKHTGMFCNTKMQRERSVFIQIRYIMMVICIHTIDFKQAIETT